MSKSNKFVFPDNVAFNDAALSDFLELDHSLQIPVFKAIRCIKTMIQYF